MYEPFDPITIRDATADIVKAIPSIQKVYVGRTTPATDAPLPFASVFQLDEVMTPIGDANVGEPKFEHKLTLIVELMTESTSSDQLDYDIDELLEQTKTALFCSATYITMFEAIGDCRIGREYFQKEETYKVMITFEIEFIYRSTWAPMISTIFEGVNVSTKLPHDKYGQEYYTQFDLRK